MIRLYGKDTANNHNFDDLIKCLICLDKSNDDYIEVMKKYLLVPLKVRFLERYRKSQKIGSINSLYQSFRYPIENKTRKAYEYFVIKYQESCILADVKEVIDDIDTILKGAVKEYHRTCDLDLSGLDSAVRPEEMDHTS